MASARSVGKELKYADFTFTVKEAEAKQFDDLDIAIFSAGADTSRALAEEAASRGCIVIDNSSAFRMAEDVPLVIPEINPNALKDHKGIIANPNCSTAITLMGLAPLHVAFGLKRFFASTYQAVSGSGIEGLNELEQQVKAWTDDSPYEINVYPHPIAFNVIPHVDDFREDGYTKEEMKMLYESQKILQLPDLRVSTTCVRVPVMRAHSIAISAEFEREVDLEQARAAIEASDGVELMDDPGNNLYPTPLEYSEQLNCGVGRLRRDAALDNGLAFWVVGDQLWKGAALNAVQIAEEMVHMGLVKPGN